MIVTESSNSNVAKFKQLSSIFNNNPVEVPPPQTSAVHKLNRTADELKVVPSDERESAVTQG